MFEYWVFIFMKEQIIKLRKEGKTYNEIKAIVGCAKSTISYHCKLLNTPLKQPTNEEIILFQKLYNENKSANIVGKLTGWSRHTVLKYLVNKKINLTKEEKKIKNVESVSFWRKRTKQKLVDYKGGKCIECGYKKCIDALEFHHRNPNEKEFGISTKGTTRSYKKLIKEVDKCDLLCSNCHKEIHYKLKTNYMPL